VNAASPTGLSDPLHAPLPAIGLWRLLEWGLDEQALARWFEQAVELGARVFDMADIYGDYRVEAAVGRALALRPALRERMVLVSKCGIRLLSGQRPAHLVKHYDSSREHLFATVDGTLRDLGTDRLDVLLLHRPDPLMDADEVADAVITLMRAGKVRHVGVSNFTPSQFDLLAARLPGALLTNQIEYSPLRPDPMYDGTLDQCQRLRVTPMAWSPLGGGAIVKPRSLRAWRVRRALGIAGREHGWSVDQTALAWIQTHPARCLPVLGTRSLERIGAAIAVAGRRLERQSWYAILEASHGRRVP
jgi:predicted oxidoreductase